VPRTIWLVIKLGQDIIPLSIVTKFQEDLIKTVRLRELKHLRMNGFWYRYSICDFVLNQYLIYTL